MGSPANVYVKDQCAKEETGVFLYQHYDGQDLPSIVQAALARGRDRWTESDYLTRIIFSEMVKGDIEGTMGYGISVEIGPGGANIVIIDSDKQTVSFGAQGSRVPLAHKTWTMEQFVKLSATEINRLWYK